MRVCTFSVVCSYNQLLFIFADLELITLSKFWGPPPPCALKLRPNGQL
jgi:hypothetical protein